MDPYLLSDLTDGPPEILGLYTMAVVTHLTGHGELHHEHLLQNRTVHHLKINNKSLTELSDYKIFSQLGGAGFRKKNLQGRLRLNR